MDIQRNLKNFLKKDFPWFKFDYIDHTNNNNLYTRKAFLIQVSKTSNFCFYNLKCEIKNLIIEFKKSILQIRMF